MPDMRDLLVIMPSRGRAEQLRVALEAAYRLAELPALDVIVGLDLDDPALPAYRELDDGRTMMTAGDRRTLTGWTNHLFRQFGAGYRFIASFGDDHVPQTPGWDAWLTQAAMASGLPGMAYPEDGRRNDIPEAIVMAREVPDALGWVCEPSLAHFWVDNVWAAIGQDAGCLEFCPDVVIEHRHYLAVPGVARDATYAEAEDKSNWQDSQLFNAWDRERRVADAGRVIAMRRSVAAGAAGSLSQAGPPCQVRVGHRVHGKPVTARHR
jgi:hypothetical protein